MKIVYIGIDLLYPALPAFSSVCEISRIVTCQTDNVTEFNTRVCEFAKNRKIPLKIGKITEEDIREWKEESCDFAVCAGFYYKIPVIPDFLIINIHPSLLPKGRGAWPMPITILRKLPYSGITFHKMEKELDTGDIILQEKVEVSGEENLETLVKKLQGLLPAMVKKLAAGFEELVKTAKPQGEGEYWECIEETDMPLDGKMSVERADRILRAFYGYECIYRDGTKTFGLIRGKVCQDVTEFPISGGYITAEKVRVIEDENAKDTDGNEG